MCFLVGSLPNGLVFRHELANQRSTIGRMGISTILLEEESVSALHAELIRVGDRRYLLRDLRSRNGTSVDGEKVSEAEIKAPCRLGFGHLSCELQLCESESCMAHGRSHPPANTLSELRRPVAPAAPVRPAAPPEQPARRRKARPLSRKRRAKQAKASKLDLASALAASEPARRDTSPDSFAPPHRFRGDRTFRFSPKVLALGASVLIFCALAVGYSRPGQAARVGAKASPAPQLARAASPEPIAQGPVPEKESGGPVAAVFDTPAASPAPEAVVATAPTVPPAQTGPLAAIAKADEKPAPIADDPEEEAVPVSTLEATNLAAAVAEAEGALLALATPARIAPAVEPPAVVEALPALELPPLAGAAPVPEASPKADTPPVAEATADPEKEELILLQEAKLLASVSKQEPPAVAIPVALTPEENTEEDENESDRPAPLDFSMPMAVPAPRRPWEIVPDRPTHLVLNDYSRLVAPWSLEAGAAHLGDSMASFLNRPPTVRVPVPVPAKPEVQEPVSVMILGDSLALCGFGSRLDKRFRESSNVRSTSTYMACGTVPMSWIKEPPYTSLKTYCGFWTIEDPVAANKKPTSFQDTYGMGKGKPKAYAVPKIEELFAKAAPEVLILQTGTNLFSLFRDGKTVQPEQHTAMLRTQIQPFLAKILKLPQPPRAIYWVASPTSGRVSTEVQDFVIDQVTAMVGPMAKVIDSRQLVSFPYRHMEPDKEHFIGQDMDQWADRVYDIVQRDLAAHPLPLALARPPGLEENKPTIAVAKPVEKANANDPTAVRLTAKLLSKTKPMRLDELKPYRESLVSFVYEVQKVIAGEYAETKILVMQPAHIDNVPQALDKLRIGQSYELTVHELQEGSPWMTIKKKDDSGLIDLLPYIRISDEARFPGHQAQASR